MRYQKELDLAMKIIKDACIRYLDFNYTDTSKPVEEWLISDTSFDMEVYISNNIKNSFDGDGIVSEIHNSKQFVSHRTWTLEHISKIDLIREGIKSFGIQLSLAEAKEIVLSLIYLPYYDEMYHAILGEGAYLNNQKIFAVERRLNSSNICFGQFDSDDKNNSNSQVEMMKNLRKKINNIYLFGSNSLSFACLASGKVDGVVLFSHNCCDINPGVLLCKEAGCSISNINGTAYTFEDTGVIMASNASLLATLTNSALPKNDDGFDTSKSLIVGYYGLPGSIHERAAHKMAENLNLNQVEYLPISSAREVVLKLQTGSIAYGALPIRDEDGCVFTHTQQAIGTLNLDVANVERIDVQYSIFKKHKDVLSGDLTSVATQGFVFSKVDKILHILMANAQRIECEDSTLAAKKLSGNEFDEKTAIVCTHEAGALNRLCLIKENINNDGLPKIIEYKLFKATHYKV